ncbi:MAG TPA: hypothetical protein VGB15_00065 [Longimicrobium sp.]|jgi:hypothetical protein
MRRISPIIPLLFPALAACGAGGERVSIRGDFADTAAMPTAVYAVEAQRQVEVKRGAFELGDLSAGPVTLRLVRGVDTVGTLSLQNVPAGTELELQKLQTDGDTRRAFPRSLALQGPPVLLVNGIRMGRADALPEQVDARGTVLAMSDDHAALLVRPFDAALPDMRVVVGLGTETVTPDSTAIEADAILPTDSVRVEGRVDQGFVVASRITVLRHGDTAMRDAQPAAFPPAQGDGEPEPDADPQPAAASTPAPIPAAVRVPVRVPREIRRQIDGPGNGRGGGKGRGQGRGKKG